MVGPPGSGKSMLAERVSSLLPPLNRDEMLRVASTASVAGDRVRRSVSIRGLQPVADLPVRIGATVACYYIMIAVLRHFGDRL